MRPFTLMPGMNQTAVFWMQRSSLLYLSKMRRNMKKEIRLFWENVARAIYQYDYSRAWIRELKQKGYHVYILSNYGKWTYEHTAEALSFLSDVDGQVFSFEVHQIKPEPEIYRTLLDKFNLVADECVF